MTPLTRYLNGYVLVVPIIIGAFASGLFYLSEGSSIPLTLFQLFLVIGFGLFVLKKLIDKDTEIFLFGIESRLLLFFLIISFSLIFSVERDQGLFYFARFIVLIIMTYVIYNSINTEKEFKGIVLLLILTAVVISVINLVEIYFNPEIAAFNFLNEGRKLMRVRGVETDPNVFASNFIFPVILSFALFSHFNKLLYKVIFFSSFIILISTVLLTYSRSVWVSLFFGLSIIVIYQKNYKVIFYSLILFFVLFTFSESVRSLLFSVFDRLFSLLSTGSDDSSNIRVILAKTALIMTYDSYFLGVGFQSFSTYFQHHVPAQLTAGVYEPHNEYYTVLSELGILGLVVFISLLKKIYSDTKTSISNFNGNSFLDTINLSLTAAFICYLIFHLFYSGMLQHTILFITISLLYVSKKTFKQE